MTVDVARPSIFDTDRSTPTTPPAAIAPPASVRRRLAAWAVDLALMTLPPAAVAASQARTVVPDPAAPFAPDPSWLTVAGTGYSWTANGAALTGVAALLAALIILTLVPANTSGWSPGLRLARLRVMTTTGTRAELHHHLVRTVFGLIDLVPFVIPGLLGWFLAYRSPLHQRLGDRLARTMVVDLHHPERPIDPSAARKPRSGPLGAPTGPRPTSGPLPAAVARRTSPSPTGSEAAPDPQRAAPATPSRWRVEQIDAPAGPTLPPILPDTVEVSVPAPTHRRLSGPIPRRGSPLAGSGPGTRRPDPLAAQASRLLVSVPRRAPETAAGPEPELVPEWSDQWRAWVVHDAATGRLFRHDAATGGWLPI
ncbi:MAG: RDD family protein [Acidimicrobiales bacterium]